MKCILLQQEYQDSGRAEQLDVAATVYITYVVCVCVCVYIYMYICMYV
jgi:hypothetical protein